MRIALDKTIDWEEPLWRYFKTEHFLELLKTGQLYFASANQFQDPFEGAVAILPPEFPVDPRFAEPAIDEQSFDELRRLTKINCWHRAAYESDAMWQLYSGGGKGIAVLTNAGRIEAAAKPFRLKPEFAHEDLWAGYVRYVDLLKERLSLSMLDRFWYKHMAFSWEREFRLATSFRIPEEFGVSVPAAGIKVDFDTSQLIDCIFFGPSLPKEDVETVREAARAAGLDDRIRVSSMLGTPRYA